MRLLCGILDIRGFRTFCFYWEVLEVNQKSVKEQGDFENIHNDRYLDGVTKPVGTENWVFGDLRGTQSLDGEWYFSPDPFDSCLRGQWYLEKRTDDSGREVPCDYDFESWDLVTVPHVWNLDQEKWYFYEGPAVYVRDFTYEDQGEAVVKLRFSGTCGETRVFCNGHFVGSHKGDGLPFFVTVQDSLKKNAQNRLIVVVDNTRKREGIPSVNIDWFQYGGISDHVDLLRLPKIHISRFRLELADENTGELRGSIVLSEAEDAQAEVEIPELGVSSKVEVKQGSASFSLRCDPAGLQLWSPEAPKRYQVIVRCGEDTAEDWIGLRTLRVDGLRILLNGQQIHLKGICMHAESLEHGRALTEEEIRQRLQLAKELGCNYVRLTHYPHSGLTARLADEIGLLLWEEIAVYWWIDFENPETVRNGETQLHELISRDYNRAAAAVWSVGNENPDSDNRLRFMSRLAKLAKQEDPGRFVSAACLTDLTEKRIHDRLAEYLDIIGINEYYGWYQPDFDTLLTVLERSKLEKPVVISECGGDAVAGYHGKVGELSTEEHQEWIYQRQVETFQSTPYIQGSTPWILFDFRSHRRCGRMQKGFNIKGLVSADLKHRKKAFAVLREFYQNW